MSWLSIIAGFLGLIQAVVNYLHDRKLIDQGVAQELLKSNQETLDAITKATAAKQAISDAAIRDPSSIMSDDGFKHPDK